MKPARRAQRGVPFGCPLTRPEFAAARHTSLGLTPKQTALELDRTDNAVRSLLSQARGRVGAKTTAELVAIGTRRRWFEGDLAGDWAATPAQRLYLDGFDQLLCARDTRATRAARARMDHHLQSIYLEKAIAGPLAHEQRRERQRRHSKLAARLPDEALPNLERT